MRQVIARTDQISDAELPILKKRRRLASLLSFAVILLTGFWSPQALKGAENTTLSEDNRSRVQWMDAPRGTIVDRQSRPLIVNRPGPNGTMGRDYFYENLGSHLLGYLGPIDAKEIKEHEGEYQPKDQIGKLGLERIYEKQLRGKPGRRSVEVDAQGVEQREISLQQPIPGSDLKLTIDRDLQNIAEEALSGTAGAAVIMEVVTGRVLALASSPPLDQYKFVGGVSPKNWEDMQRDELKPLTNKAIQGQYPPGSIYTMVVALAGLNEGVIDQDTTFFCNGSIKRKDQDYPCSSKHGHGAVTLERALAESCDVFFYTVGMKVGGEKLAHYAKSLGLGQPTGINLDHEKGGVVPSTDWKKKRFGQVWHNAEAIPLSIGQGYALATPLQICQMTSVLVNGGIRYRPQVVEAIMTIDGKVAKGFEPIVDGHVSGTVKSLNEIRDGMVAAVNTPQGAASIAKSSIILVGAKIGTAQVVKPEEGEPLKENEIPYTYRDHAWFTCFAPADKPEIAITVLVEHGLHGDSEAGSVARRLLQEYFKGIRLTKEREGVVDNAVF